MTGARVVAGRYRLTRQLGRGGMGAVWLAQDELAGRLVAVKELRAPDGVSDDERDVFRKRALQEARSAARLAHPNAVTLHDIIPATPADDAVYLILEYVDGATLAEVVAREGRIGEPRATGIALQLLSILEAAHGLGIVHRDIKPANIMITSGDQVKLADFGIAHVVGGTRLTGSGVIGTPAYMAPEQLEGQPITPAVDLWSLGVTLYDAVTGRNPFDRETTAAVFHAILLGQLPAYACAPPMGAVIAGLLVRDPAQRMTIGQARRLITAGASCSLPPAGGPFAPVPAAGSSGAQGAGANGAGPGGFRSGAGPATYPGGQGPDSHPTGPSYRAIGSRPGGPGHPGTVRAGRPAGRRRVRISIAAVAAVAVAGVVWGVIALAALHSGSSGRLAPGTPSASPSGGSAGTAVPGAYLGRWQGTLADNTGLEGTQSADLTLVGGAVNAVVGAVRYPVVGCRYDLRLVAAAADQVELFEQIRSGLCQSEYVVLVPSGTGLTESVYPGPPDGGQPDFTGSLAKGAPGPG